MYQYGGNDREKIHKDLKLKYDQKKVEAPKNIIAILFSVFNLFNKIFKALILTAIWWTTVYR